MAIKPRIKTLSNSSVDILNAIRNGASVDYKNYVPVATSDMENIRGIGNILLDMPNLQNEFLNSLVNRIARVIVTSKSYSNPLKMFKKGFIEYGETIEEIFVDIAKPFQYDSDTAESTVWKKEKPDVKSIFHILNYQVFYKSTIQPDMLRRAFTSAEGVTGLITDIVNQLYASSEYDEYLTMKYLVARAILNGQMKPVAISSPTSDNVRQIVSTVKAISNNMTFKSRNYTLFGNTNQTLKENQYILIDTNFEALMNVEVLATSFNMDKATFMGHVVLIDGFGNLDSERLNMLFDNDDTYVEITTAEKQALNKVPLVIVDDNFFQIYDNLDVFKEIENGEGLYWNYWRHCWKTFSTSPFSNRAMLVEGSPTVESVVVSPTQATIPKNGSLALNVVVNTENFASKEVTFTASSHNVEVTASGVIHVNGQASGQSTVTVKSKADPSKQAVCTITIA